MIKKHLDLLEQIVERKDCSGIQCNDCLIRRECRVLGTPITPDGAGFSQELYETAKRKWNLMVNLEAMKNLHD